MTNSLQPVSLRIIADDLTGACDAAVAFACVGMVTEVETSWAFRQRSDTPVVALNTESRDVAAALSSERMKEAASYVAADEAEHIFKKIDSVFRGNTCTEIAAILAAVPHDLAILAPAYPELGRTVVHGELRSRDVAGEHAIPIMTQLQAAGVDLKILERGEAIEAGNRVLLCDSITQEDLCQVAQDALVLPFIRRILWIGSGGLAHALAAALRRDAPQPMPILDASRVLFVVGSDHPVTLRQVSHLRQTMADARVFSVQPGMAVADMRERLTPSISKGITCLFATGGDTGLAVCEVLGIRRLRVEAEFARGLPLARIVGGLLDGTSFLLKSGGFGDEDVLSRIAQNLLSSSNQETRIAR